MKSLKMLDTVTDREHIYADLRSKVAAVLALKQSDSSGATSTEEQQELV